MNFSPTGGHLLGKTKYQLYKAATSAVSDWLASTARRFVNLQQHGLSSLFRSMESSEGDGAALGARLKVSHFLPLTDLIVKVDPRVKVPARIVKLARMTLAARMERNRFMKGIDPESDQRHEHFISVIREVHDKLQEHYEKHTNEKEKDLAKIRTTIQESKNVFSFELLELEDLIDDGDDTEDSIDISNLHINDLSHQTATKSKKKKSKKARDRQKARAQAMSAEGEDEDEDPYFVLMCLLSDMISMRKYIKEIWEEYKQGKTDLITVSLTTNSAFDIIRTYEDDFPAIKPLLQNYTNTLTTIFSGGGIFLESKMLLAEGHIGAHAILVAWALSQYPELTELTFATSVYFLNHYHRNLLKQNYYDSQVDDIRETRATSTVKLNHLHSAILDDIETLDSIAHSIYDFIFPMAITCDHFTDQWTTAKQVKDDSITLSRAFGCQIYLDICHTLEDDMKRGYKDLLAICSTARQDLKFMSKVTPKLPYLPQEDYRMQAAEKDHIGFLTYQANYLHRHAEIWSQIQDSWCESGYMHTLSPFELNPLLCGVAAFQMKMATAFVGGVNKLIRTNSVGSAGQLYYACLLHRDLNRGDGILSSRKSTTRGAPFSDDYWATSALHWEEMETFMKEYALDERFFCQIRPRCNYDLLMYHSSYPYGPLSLRYEEKPRPRFFQTSMDAAFLSANLPAPTKGGKLADEDVAKMYSISNYLFCSKYYTSQGSTPALDWTHDGLKVLLNTYLQKEDQSAATTMEAGDNETMADAKPSSQMKPIHKNKLANQVAVLRELKTALQREKESEVSGTAFHSYCIKLLQHLRTEICKVIPELRDGTHFKLDDPTAICGFARLAFQYMTIDEQRERFWRMGTPPSSNTPVITTIFIAELDRIFREYLANHPFRDRKTWMASEDLDLTWPVMTPSNFTDFERFGREL